MPESNLNNKYFIVTTIQANPTRSEKIEGKCVIYANRESVREREEEREREGERETKSKCCRNKTFEN